MKPPIVIFIDKDGSNHIDQPGRVSHLDDMSISDECIEETRNNQGVFQIVFFLQHISSTRGGGAAGTIPDIVFIPGNIYLTRLRFSGKEVRADSETKNDSEC